MIPTISGLNTTYHKIRLSIGGYLDEAFNYTFECVGTAPYCQDNLDCSAWCGDKVYSFGNSGDSVSSVTAPMWYNLNGGSWTLEYTPGSNETINDDSTWRNGVSAGDLDTDSHQEILFYSLRYIGGGGGYSFLGWRVMPFDTISKTFQPIMNITIASGSNVLYPGPFFFTKNIKYVMLPIAFTKIGTGLNTEKIIMQSEFTQPWGFGPIDMVTEGKVYNYDSSPFSTAYYIHQNSFGPVHQNVSNFVSGDIASIGQNYFCVYAQGLKCFDGGGTSYINCTFLEKGLDMPIAISYGVAGITGWGIVTPYSIYKLRNGTCTDYDIIYSPWQYAMPTLADLTNDGATDVIITDNNEIKVYKTTPTEGCTPISCTFPCIMRDNFDYTCPLQSMGWNIIPPNPDLMPEAGQMCEVGDTDFYLGNTPNGWADVITDEFSITFTDEFSHGLHDITFFDSTDNVKKSAIKLQFDPTLVTDFMNISYWNISVFYYKKEIIGGILQERLEPICTSCIGLNQKAPIKITMYNADTYSKSFRNTTNNQTQLILPNTLTVNIGGVSGVTIYNIPILEPLNMEHSNKIWRSHFWLVGGNGQVCVDDFKVYGGFSFDTFDLSRPDLVNISRVEGCWDTKTGEFQCWVSGCQDCCEIFPDNSVRVRDFGCVLGKSAGFWLDGVKDWILDHIVVFILVLFILVLLIPVLLRILEITRGLGNRGY
jgi:hypothetical protein